ncbi:hypothetical protein KY326_02550, partial [Candidatus Woesearchaeota archaeon]|nr:hypothetical protein [Candidatus Woesearchaeota archaeon]
YEIVRKKFKTTKRSAREKYIHQAFSDYCPYSERAVRGLSNPAWYTKAASFLGSAAAGGLLGTVADQYLHLGEKLQPIFNTVYEFLSTI